MSEMKTNLTDVAEYLDYSYDNLVEYIQEMFTEGKDELLPYNKALEIADEMCDKMAHIAEIQANSMANEKEAKEFVDDCLKGNA